MSKMGMNWQLCERLGSVLDITKHQVFTYLFSFIKENDLAERILNRDPEALSIIYNSVGWKRMIEVIEYEEKEEKEEKELTNSNKVKIAFWFIDKCGGTDKAKKALNAAIKALSEFES